VKVPPFDAAAFGTALRELFADDERRWRMGAAAPDA